jgi:hypothetical protein
VIGTRRGWPHAGRVVVPVVVVALVIAGCGGQSSPRRAQLAHYVTSVNRVEQSLMGPLMTVTRVSATVSGRHQKALTERSAAILQRRLATSVSAIRAQERRLSAIPVPRPATHLRALLLRYTTAEADLTAQLDLLVGFLPRFSAVLAPLGLALTRLEAALGVHEAAGAAAVSAVYAAKVQALRAFQRMMTRIIGRLRRLAPPAVSLPAYRAQLASLRGMGTSARRLAGALAGGAPGNVTPLLVAFDRAALATRSRSAQTAESAAIRRYDAQASSLTTLAEDIARERLRLAASVR